MINDHIFVQRLPIDPFAYSHRADNSATYVPKQRPQTKQTWQKVTDTTGRGYGPANKKETGTVSNMNTKSQLPKPDM